MHSKYQFSVPNLKAVVVRDQKNLLFCVKNNFEVFLDAQIFTCLDFEFEVLVDSEKYQLQFRVNQEFVQIGSFGGCRKQFQKLERNRFLSWIRFMMLDFPMIVFFMSPTRMKTLAFCTVSLRSSYWHFSV